MAPKSALAVRRERAAAAAAAAAAAPAATASPATKQKSAAVKKTPREPVGDATSSPAAAPSARALATAVAEVRADGERERASKARSRKSARTTVSALAGDGAARAPVEVEASTSSTPASGESSRVPSAEMAAAPLAAARVPSLISPATHADQFTYQSDGVVLCALQHGERILVRGLAVVQVVRGCVWMAGATLDASSRPAPLCASQVGPATELVAQPTRDEREDRPGSSCPTVVRLASQRSGLENLARVCPLAGPDPWSQAHARPGATFSILAEAAESLCLPGAWQAGMARLGSAPAPVVVVRGAKNTGKSTLARMALHALHTSGTHRFVAFLDLDAGQPEFGPPGMLALHVWDTQSDSILQAPAWCSARTPAYAHFLGDVTPRDDPARYIAAAMDLMEHFRADWQYFRDASQIQARLPQPQAALDTHAARRRGGSEQSIPLVVNTHGWVKGLGLDLLQQLTAALLPTLVLDLGALPLPGADLTLPPYSETEEGAVTWQRTRRLNAAEARSLSLLSYLHMTRLPTPGTGELPAWNWDALVAQRPWIVDLRTGLGAGLALLKSGADVDNALGLLAINGGLVALAQAPPVPVEAPASPDAEAPVWSTAWASPERPGPAASTAPAWGLALVRSIDVAQGELHLLTPVSPGVLASRVAALSMPLGLVHGALELPIWASLDADTYADVMMHRRAPASTHLAGVPRSEVPYLQWPPELLAGESEGASPAPDEPLGARPRKIRRNLMRRRHGAT